MKKLNVYRKEKSPIYHYSNLYMESLLNCPQQNFYTKKFNFTLTLKEEKAFIYVDN